MDINQKLTEELDVNRWQIDAAVTLIDEGNTIPFISRYRKEATGSLNDEQLRKLHERLLYLRNLEEKKEQVISSIEEQGKMTEELKEKILLADSGRSVSAISSEAADEGNDRERKRIRAFGSVYDAAAGKRTFGRNRKAIYFGRKRSKDRGRSNRRSKRHYCGNHFR